MTYEQYCQLCAEQEEAERNKRPAHRPKEELFVEGIDKEKIVGVIKSVLQKVASEDGSRFGVGKIHFGRNRFWAFIYVALAECGAIKLGNNVVHFYNFLTANIEGKYLTDRKHMSDIIHDITDEESEIGSFLNIKSVEDINNLGHVTTTQKSFITACLGIRILFAEEFSKNKKYFGNNLLRIIRPLSRKSRPLSR